MLFDAPAYHIEYLHYINPSGVPPRGLTLKVGQPILLLRSMDPKLSLCNGYPPDRLSPSIRDTSVQKS